MVHALIAAVAAAFASVDRNLVTRWLAVFCAVLNFYIALRDSKEED